MNLKEIYEAYQLDASFDHLRSEFNFVPGIGSENAQIVFVGEAPGAQENERQEPFIGVSGQLLNRKLHRIGLDRTDVFLTNVLKYRPSTSNRDPSVPEIQASLMYLGAEIKTINPKLIVALGRIPAKAFLPGRPMRHFRGKILPYKEYKLLITYHPSYIKHNPDMERPFDQHFDLIRQELGKSSAA